MDGPPGNVPDRIKPDGPSGDASFRPSDRAPSPDEILGTRDLSGDEAIKQYFSDINKAWYRQAVTKREHANDVYLQTTLGSGDYSTETAGETLARLNEAAEGSNHAPAAAKALIRHHPDLLESFRQVRDIPPEFKERLNDELDSVDAEFRFEVSE
jgi:hypothetical protein